MKKPKANKIHLKNPRTTEETYCGRANPLGNKLEVTEFSVEVTCLSCKKMLDDEVVIIKKKEVKPSCKTCKFAMFAKTEKGNIRTSVAGFCGYIVEDVKFPEAVIKHYGFNWPLPRYDIWANGRYGNNCECYEELK